MRWIALVLVLCSTLQAGEVEDSVVSLRVSVAEGKAAGTGCIVSISEKLCPDERFKDWRLGTILTAAHVVTEYRVDVHLRNGELSVGNVAWRGDMVNDVALVKAYIPPGYEPVAIGEAPEHGSFVTAYGLGADAPTYPKSGEVRRLTGRRVGYGYAHDRSIYDITVRQGDSGGPIVRDGKVIGVVSGGLLPFQESNTWPLLSVHTAEIEKLTVKFER